MTTENPQPIGEIKTTEVVEPAVPEVQEETVEEQAAAVLTAEELVDAIEELKDRAREAGIRPIRMMITSYLTQGLAAVDSLLDALNSPKEKDSRGKKK